MDCNCPKNTALTEIPQQDCPFNLRQIQRYIFQRGGYLFDVAGTPPSDIQLLADWQALKTVMDDTKVVITPLIGADPVIESGDAITNGGGDNSTLNGVEENEGTNPASASAMFKSISPEIEKAMKNLICETDLVVYFVLQGGRIAAKKIEGSDQYTGFTAQSFFFSDRGNQGFGTKDLNTMTFQMPAGWSEDIVIFDSDELNFNPITDL